MQTKAPSSLLLDRITLILMSLVASVRLRVRERNFAPGMGEGVCRRICRARNLVEALILRLQAGTLRAWVRGRVARARMSEAARAKLGAVTRSWASMPRRAGWLCPLAMCTARYQDSAAQYGFDLARLLAEPEMRLLMAQVPGIGRALRPVCRMLNVDLALLEVGPVAEAVEAKAGPDPAPCPAAEAASVAAPPERPLLFCERIKRARQR